MEEGSGRLHRNRLRGGLILGRRRRRISLLLRVLRRIGLRRGRRLRRSLRRRARGTDGRQALGGALAEGAGMEPHLGFLYRVDYGRPSLALDLLEPFRAPVVDRLTLKLVNERTLTEADFGKRLTGEGAGSVILVPDSLRKYLEHYEAAAAEPRQRAPSGIRGAWQAEVEKLAAAIRDGAGFAPYCEGDGCST